MRRRGFRISRVPPWDLSTAEEPVVETFHILAETGDALDAETADNLRTE